MRQWVSFQLCPHMDMSLWIIRLAGSIGRCSLLTTFSLVKMLQSYFKSRHYLIASLLGSLLR